jgi:hypothetical protein
MFSFLREAFYSIEIWILSTRLPTRLLARLLARQVLLLVTGRRSIGLTPTYLQISMQGGWEKKIRKKGPRATRRRIRHSKMPDFLSSRFRPGTLL